MRDLILKKVGEKFSGHDLARLVEAVTTAQGYVTNRSEPACMLWKFLLSRFLYSLLEGIIRGELKGGDNNL